MKKTYKAQDLIKLLNLEPLPLEGGYWQSTYRTPDMISILADDKTTILTRNRTSVIYFLLTDEDCGFSALHQLKSDEIYHFYLGDPVEMLLLNPDGTHQITILGQDIFEHQFVQHLVPKGVWQGARLCNGGKLALLGTTMSPGFDQDDFILGDRTQLSQDYPEVAEHILRFTRGSE